jgi:4-aminobutyrate aminotransferase
MAILQKMLDHGLVGYMAGRTGQVIRLIPPVNLTEEQINKALQILEVSMSEV